MIGFVYIWHDRLKNMFYIGSHLGSEEDGYICSNRWMKAAHKKRPSDFRRRVIQRINTNYRDLLAAEQRWLDMILDTEIATSETVTNGLCRYYNMKKRASGGNGSANKGVKKKNASWRKGLTGEMIRLRIAGLLSILPVDRPKTKRVRKKREPKSPCEVRVKQIVLKKPKRSRDRICISCGINFVDETKRNERKCCAFSCARSYNASFGNPRENGKKGAEKMRIITTGRKRLYLEDGSFTWQYPE